MNGTWLNGKPIRGAATLDLDRSSILDIAGAVRFCVNPFRESHDGESLSGLNCRSLRLDPLGFDIDPTPVIVLYSFSLIGGLDECDALVPGLAVEQTLVLARTDDEFVVHCKNDRSRMHVLRDGDELCMGSLTIRLGDDPRFTPAPEE